MLTPEQLQILETQLRTMQYDLQRLLEDREAASQPVELDQQLVGRVSRIDAIQQQQMAVASFKQAERDLQQTKNMLAHIQEGEYGYCQSCDEAIPFARLQARPLSKYCIQCKEKLE